jgi:hypothetical protein
VIRGGVLIPVTPTGYFTFNFNLCLLTYQNQTTGSFLPFLSHYTHSLLGMTMAAITAYSCSYEEATNIALFVLLALIMLGVLANTALSMGPSYTAHHDEESWEAGSSVQFTNSTASYQTENDPMDLMLGGSSSA